MGTNMSRRDFVKSTAVAAGTFALASAEPLLSPVTALAATDLTEGVTYSVNAEFYISKKILLMGFNAYLTNDSDPNDGGDKPTSPNGALNSTVVKKGSSYFVTVPLVNPCFVLISADANTTDGIASVTIDKTSTAKYKDTSGNAITKIDLITLELSSQKSAYTLGDCNEYGAYASAPWPLSNSIPGYVEWPATLEVDWSTAVVK